MYRWPPRVLFRLLVTGLVHRFFDRFLVLEQLQFLSCADDTAPT
jgi:hypothetical protein